MVALVLEDGTEVLVQDIAAPEAFGAQGVGEIPKKKLREVALQSAAVLSEYIATFRSRLDQLAPNEFKVEVGYTLTIEGTLMVAKGKGEATFAVTAIWRDQQNAVNR